MLFENRKQISAEELMSKYSTLDEYKKILKKPSFEVHSSRKKIDKVNGGRIKVPAGSAVRSHFMVTDPKTKLKAEIRYAQSNNSRVVGDRIIDEFEPRYVNFTGEVKEFRNDIDLAIFYFLHTNNSISPLRDITNKAKPKLEYIDTKKRAKAKIDVITELGRAMEHSKNLPYDQLILLAKGLGMGDVTRKDEEEIRADVMTYASKNPTKYNEQTNTQITYIEGRIRYLIEKRVFKLDRVGNVRRWSWASGEREGEFILDIVNVTQDANKQLINFFFSDISRYMNVLNDVTVEMGSREKALRDLEAMEKAQEAQTVSVDTNPIIGDALPDHLKEINSTGATPTKKVYTKEEVTEMLTVDGIKPHHLKVAAELKKLNGEN